MANRHEGKGGKRVGEQEKRVSLMGERIGTWGEWGQGLARRVRRRGEKFTRRGSKEQRSQGTRRGQRYENTGTKIRDQLNGRTGEGPKKNFQNWYVDGGGKEEVGKSYEAKGQRKTTKTKNKWLHSGLELSLNPANQKKGKKRKKNGEEKKKELGAWFARGESPIKGKRR